MHIITRRKLVDFWTGKPPDVERALSAWFSIAKAANWTTPATVLRSDPKASIIPGNRVVFDILGGRFRLVVAIHYNTGAVFIRFVGTHAAYDKINAATV